LDVSVKAINPYSAEHNPAVRGYDAGVLASLTNLFDDIRDPLSVPTGNIVATGDVTGARDTGQPAFSG